MKKIIALALSALFIFGLLTACGKDANPTDGSSDAKKEYTVGICNYVDDASLNQIVENIQARLEEIGKEKNVTFKIEYDNCNADANLMSQIIANFQVDNVDLMVGVATPVAMAMQAATEDTKTPVVFSAVTDPVSAQVPLVDGDHPAPSRAVFFFHECAGVQCRRHVQYVSDFHRSPSIQERKRMNHPATLAVPMIMIAATIPISMLMRSPFFRRSSDLAKPYRYSTI